MLVSPAFSPSALASLLLSKLITFHRPRPHALPNLCQKDLCVKILLHLYSLALPYFLSDCFAPTRLLLRT